MRNNRQKEKLETDDHHQKILALLAAVVAIIALVIIPTLAWLSYQKTLEAITLVNSPNALGLGAGDLQSVKELDLSNLDVSDPKKYKDVVFCVYSESKYSYQLQLAHTTNIGFTYQIFPANIDENGSLEYLGKKYLFNTEVPLVGEYLNQRDDGSKIAKNKGAYHDKTYAVNGETTSYSYVQPNAEPLYWKSTENQTLPDKKESGSRYHVKHYVLRISWDETVQNNKETDLVYLMAEIVSSTS